MIPGLLPYSRRLLPVLTLAFVVLSITGCGSSFTSASQGAASTAVVKLTGNVHGGQQAVTGAQVYLYAVSNQNGGTATSLLYTSGFTLSDLNGNFSITNDYPCPTNAYVYILAIGGNPGLGLGTNSEIALAAGLGPCSALTSSSYFAVNEVTTAAFAYAMSAYATSDTQIGTTTNLASAFAYINTVLNPATGMAIPSQGTTVLPQLTLNSLANAISACVNSNGVGAPCSTLMTAANASPTNTFQAALKIAQSPGTNVSTIYNLSTPNQIFQPALTAPPASWTLAAGTTSGQIVADANTYLFNTSLGDICVELRPDVAPLTVANFRYYVNNGSYANNMFLHRSEQGFITQGGGYDYVNGTIQTIPTATPVNNEYNLPNTRGTIAMATSYGSPNSATDQFFFNDVDNSAVLNAQNGAYTVFGSIVGVSGSSGCGSANPRSPTFRLSTTLAARRSYLRIS
jgi:cyclophilin family peptidyl-prolyl cis-trans isomerase